MKGMRVMAQLVDIFVLLAVLVGSFVLLAPRLTAVIPPVAAAVATIVMAAALEILVQLPFLRQSQTVGKAFFGLEIASTDPLRPISLSVLLQREVFCKLMSCYIICIPALLGKEGGHETATQTQVIRKRQPAKSTGK